MSAPNPTSAIPLTRNDDSLPRVLPHLGDLNTFEKITAAIAKARKDVKVVPQEKHTWDFHIDDSDPELYTVSRREEHSSLVGDAKPKLTRTPSVNVCGIEVRYARPDEVLSESECTASESTESDLEPEVLRRQSRPLSAPYEPADFTGPIIPEATPTPTPTWKDAPTTDLTLNLEDETGNDLVAGEDPATPSTKNQSLGDKTAIAESEQIQQTTEHPSSPPAPSAVRQEDDSLNAQECPQEVVYAYASTVSPGSRRDSCFSHAELQSGRRSSIHVGVQPESAELEPDPVALQTARRKSTASIRRLSEAPAKTLLGFAKADSETNGIHAYQVDDRVFELFVESSSDTKQAGTQGVQCSAAEIDAAIDVLFAKLSVSPESPKGNARMDVAIQWTEEYVEGEEHRDIPKAAERRETQSCAGSIQPLQLAPQFVSPAKGRCAHCNAVPTESPAASAPATGAHMVTDASVRPKCDTSLSPHRSQGTMDAHPLRVSTTHVPDMKNQQEDLRAGRESRSDSQPRKGSPSGSKVQVGSGRRSVTISEVLAVQEVTSFVDVAPSHDEAPLPKVAPSSAPAVTGVTVEEAPSRVNLTPAPAESLSQTSPLPAAPTPVATTVEEVPAPGDVAPADKALSPIVPILLAPTAPLHAEEIPSQVNASPAHDEPSLNAVAQPPASSIASTAENADTSTQPGETNSRAGSSSNGERAKMQTPTPNRMDSNPRCPEDQTDVGKSGIDEGDENLAVDNDDDIDDYESFGAAEEFHGADTVELPGPSEGALPSGDVRNSDGSAGILTTSLPGDMHDDDKSEGMLISPAPVRHTSRRRSLRTTVVIAGGINIEPSAVEEKPILKASRKKRKRNDVESKRPRGTKRQATGQRELKRLGLTTLHVPPVEKEKETNLDSIRPRRSKRRKFPPLQYWKNEKKKYSRRMSQIMPTVSDVVIAVEGSNAADDDVLWAELKGRKVPASRR